MIDRSYKLYIMGLVHSCLNSINQKITKVEEKKINNESVQSYQTTIDSTETDQNINPIVFYENYIETTDAKNISLDDETSDSPQLELDDDISIGTNLITDLALKYDDEKMDKLLQLLRDDAINAIDLSVEDSIVLFEKYENQLLQKLKETPVLCIAMKIHLFPTDIKSKLIEKFGIIIFDKHPNEASILLSQNLSKLSTLLKRQHMKMGNFLIEKRDNIVVLKNAYHCLSIHKWGIAYVLFRKAGYNDAVEEILNNKVPVYIRLLMQ